MNIPNEAVEVSIPAEVVEVAYFAPHGPDEPCTCEGCWGCAGAVVGCTCDIDWDELYESRRG